MLCSRRLLAAMLASAVMLFVGAFPAQAGTRRSMVRAISSVRGQHLRFSQRMSAAAAAWARHLFQAGVLAHSSRAIRAGEGEIIEWHTGTAANIGGVVREWLASPEHRPIMLSGIWHRAGAGRAVGVMNGRRSTIWVVRFAR